MKVISLDLFHISSLWKSLAFML